MIKHLKPMIDILFRPVRSRWALHLDALFLLGSLVVGASLTPAWGASNAAPAPARSPAEIEAAYIASIEKRVADILAVLELKEPAKAARVHDTLIAQYRALRAWHDDNDARLKAAGKADTNAAARIQATLKTLHRQFLDKLAADLTPGQVEQVKDKMTYNKVKVTYDAYVEIIPSLTEPQKARILELLKEAREEAMDGGSAEEKSAIFKRYKGKIANYLVKEGVDEAGARKEWSAKQKANAAAKAPSTE
jgi:hypothetical protein